MSNSVTTPLYIGGKERQTADTMAIADPAKPGVVVGYAAAATTKDVSDAVAAAKAAYPAWAALSPQQRAETMLAALAGIAENRDDDAAILSQENGKIRFEAWIDSLVLELRWKLALSHADEVNAAKVLLTASMNIVTAEVKRIAREEVVIRAAGRERPPPMIKPN